MFCSFPFRVLVATSVTEALQVQDFETFYSNPSLSRHLLYRGIYISCEFAGTTSTFNIFDVNHRFLNLSQKIVKMSRILALKSENVQYAEINIL